MENCLCGRTVYSSAHCFCCQNHMNKGVKEVLAFGALAKTNDKSGTCYLCNQFIQSNEWKAFELPCCRALMHVQCLLEFRMADNQCGACHHLFDIKEFNFTLEIVKNFYTVEKMCFVCFKQIEIEYVLPLGARSEVVLCCGRRMCKSCARGLKKTEINYSHFTDYLYKYKCVCEGFCIV